MKDYKKILEGVVNIINTTEKSDIGFTNICTYIGENCPELKESEDEKMKRIISDILLIDNDDIREILESNDVLMQDIDAWLEKQGDKDKLIQELGEYKVKYTQEVLERCINNKDFERLRKTTIDFLKEFADKGYENAVECIDWLEKSGQNKLIDKVEPKFKVGDWIANDYCAGKIIALTDDAYLLDSGQGIPFSCEHNAHFWTVEDAKDGDLIYVSTEEKGIQAIFHEYKNKTIFFHCYLCSDFEQGGYMPIGSVELVYPLQKTHYKRFFEKMHEAGYEWDSEKKEPKKIEQKPDKCEGCNNIKGCVACVDGSDWAHIEEAEPAWSEKDERMFDGLTAIVKDWYNAESEEEKEYYGDCGYINWLKSLKDRVHPQPKQWSEEDDAIYDGIIETELYMLDVVNGIKKFDVGNMSIKEECTRELNWLRSFYNDLIKNYRDYENKEI